MAAIVALGTHQGSAASPHRSPATWPSPIFLEILLVIWWSLQIRLSRNFPGNMQVLPEILQLIELSWGRRPKFFSQDPSKFVFFSALEFKFLSDPRTLSQKFCTFDIFLIFLYFSHFFSSRGREMRVYGGCLVEISRNISRKKVVLTESLVESFFGKV